MPRRAEVCARLAVDALRREACGGYRGHAFGDRIVAQSGPFLPRPEQGALVVELAGLRAEGSVGPGLAGREHDVRVGIPWAVPVDRAGDAHAVPLPERGHHPPGELQLLPLVELSGDRHVQRPRRAGVLPGLGGLGRRP